MKTLCIYHGNCADGFAAAVVVRYAMGSDEVEFHPGVYQEAPPDVTGRRVIFVDFSYKRPVLLQMAKKAESIVILDHHKSAEEDLVDLPANVQVHFDMDKSGAVVTWNYFFPTSIPKLLAHIQDRDLWKFELEGTREIQACLFSYPYDFDLWEEFIFEKDPEDFRRDGEAIERKHFKDVNELIKAGIQYMNIGGYEVPVLNAPYFYVSDAAHSMAENEAFAACYWDTSKGRVFGLRSHNDGVDVSEIAKQYGGGGHVHSAGFTLKHGDSL